MSENKYYNEGFWFSAEGQVHHGEVSSYSQDYYANKLYKQLLTKLTDVPQEGYIVVIGSNNCVSFNILCDHFGADRCLGIDIANPSNHSRVLVKDIMNFDETDNIPIALSHNDLGSFPLTPVAKWRAQVWAAKNTVSGGYVLGRNDFNSAAYPIEALMTRHEFVNVYLSGLTGLLNLDMSESVLEGHMLSKKCRPKFR